MKQAITVAIALASTSAVAGFNNVSVTPVPPVPALDTMGLVAMAAVVGIAGLLAARRGR